MDAFLAWVTKDLDHDPVVNEFFCDYIFIPGREGGHSRLRSRCEAWQEASVTELQAKSWAKGKGNGRQGTAPALAGVALQAASREWPLVAASRRALAPELSAASREPAGPLRGVRNC